MVKIISYQKRQKEDGSSFFVLELQGGLEMLLSKSTGQYYASAKKARISSTFDEQTCKALIGTEMPGSIVKQECEPYSFTVKETGEIISMAHRWVYTPETVKEQTEQATNQYQPKIQQFDNNMAYAS